MQFRKNVLPLLMIFFMSLSRLCFAQEVEVPEPPDELGVLITQIEQQEAASSKEEQHVGYIVPTYGVPEADARGFVAEAKKNADPVFPKYEDILGFTEIESNFKKWARSKRNCLGALQLKFAYHKTGIRTHKELMVVSTNLRIGSDYMRELFSQLKSRSASVMSFNLGLGSYKKGKRNRDYLAKFEKARKHFI